MTTSTEAVSKFVWEEQPKVTVDRCPLCQSLSSDTAARYARADRYGIPQPSLFCTNCAFIYLSPRLTTEAYADFHDKWYRKLVEELVPGHGPEEVLSSQTVYATRLVKWLPDALLSQPFRQRCLDVGGSAGIVSNALRLVHGYRCTVLDPNSEELAIAAKYGHETFCGGIEDYEPKGTFDLICVSQTIDHLVDPVLSLIKLKRLLSPWGLLFVDFANHLRVERNASRDWSIKTDHPCNFAAETAVTALQRSGFESLHSSMTSDYHLIMHLCRPVPIQPHALPPRQFVDDRMMQLNMGPDDDGYDDMDMDDEEGLENPLE